MKKLFTSFIFMILYASPMVALAQESQPTPAPDLDACVSYFTQGDVWNWIGGGLIVATGILGIFSKASWLGILKSIGKAVADKAKNKG